MSEVQEKQQQLIEEINFLSGKLKYLTKIFIDNQTICYEAAVLEIGAHSEEFKVGAYNAKEHSWYTFSYDMPEMVYGTLHWYHSQFYIHSGRQWFLLRIPNYIDPEQPRYDVSKIKLEEVDCKWMASAIGREHIEHSGMSVREKNEAYKELEEKLDYWGFENKWSGNYRSEVLFPGELAAPHIEKKLKELNEQLKKVNFEVMLEELPEDKRKELLAAKEEEKRIEEEKKKAEKQAREQKKKEAEEAKRRKEAEEKAQREKEEALEKELRKTSLPLNLIKWGLSILLLYMVDGFFMSIMASGIAFVVMNFCFKPIINKKRKELGLKEE